jgi:hypothetical protein
VIHNGFLIAMVVLPVLWIAPLAVFCVILYFESGRSGPQLRWHVPINVAFLAWCSYAVLVLRGGLHSVDSPLIVVPRLLVMAMFYAFAVPQLVSAPVPRRLFRYAFGIVYLIAFALLFLSADWVGAFTHS